MNTEQPTVKTTTTDATYFDRRCTVTTIHHDTSRTGLRTVRREWVDEADTKSGGWAAGTTTETLIKGDGRNKNTFEVLVPEHAIRGDQR